MRLHGYLLCVSALLACSVSEEADDAPVPADGDGADSTRDGASGDDTSGDGSVVDTGATSDSGTLADGSLSAAPLFAFVGGGGKITAYAVDSASGTFTKLKETSAGTNPSFLAFDPSRRRVVALDEAENLVRSFSFDPSTGSLTPINTKPSGGNGPAHISLDPTGNWVFAANYGGGTMSVFPIDTTGSLGNASDTRASGNKSHWVGTNPSGNYVFVPALGANLVAQYALNVTTGKLTDNGSVSPPAGAGPRHLAFHPTEKWAYLINETAISVTALDFDKTTGKLSAKQTLSALPPGQSAAGVSGAEIFVHPNGKHVYASTRIYNSIVQFSVGADGALTRVANVTTGGNRPRSFGMDPEGTLLFAGNQDVNQVVGFRIDTSTGSLTPLGKTADVDKPSFVGLVRVP